MSKNGEKYQSPYWFINTLAVVVVVAIIIAAIKISIVDAKHWDAKSEELLQLNTERVALPMRGSILAHDGSPIAQTVELYTAYVDFAASRSDDTLYINVRHAAGDNRPDTLCLDTLCQFLATHYPKKTKAEYAMYITKKWKEDARDCILAENITEAQYDELYNLSIFANRRKTQKFKNSGLSRVRSYKRYYPYEGIAPIVIGRASQLTGDMIKRYPNYKDRREWHGSSGLELGLDSFLFGKYGSQQKQQLSNRFALRIVDQPVAGYDVVTTLDMTIQEIAERTLMEKVVEQHAEYGTAVVMEVATGEIRAMANVERNKKGKYTTYTKRNYATTNIEPGSVVKTLSLLVAMENCHIDPYKLFDSENPIPELKTLLEPHKNPLSARDVIVLSDNRGICKIIGSNYRGRYNDFVKDIQKTGLMKTMDCLYLPNMQKPYIKPIKFNLPWKYYAFAQMIFGYQNELSPVTTLSIYNAIANDGRLMQPKLIKSLMRNGEVDTVFAPVCLNEKFCTPQNAAILREMLHGVVYDVYESGGGGTARALRTGRVEIAGKTGTVQAQREIYFKTKDGRDTMTVDYDRAERRLAFAGFFPYDNPQYSCIVVIDKPDLHSAARVSGAVLRNIAEEMYGRNMLEERLQYTSNEKDKNPPQAIGIGDVNERVYAYLRQYPTPDTTHNVAVTSDNLLHIVEPEVPRVPSVIGMSAKDALYLLELQGLAVEMIGNGRVVHQSLSAGLSIQKGTNIKLTLN